VHDPGETLVAVGTPPGRGGIGCVRLSGPEAERIARRLFIPTTGADRTKRGHSSFPGGQETMNVPISFGRFVDRQGRPVDHGFLVLFEPRRSYTGEDGAELWTHGSPAVLAELVEAAIAAGAALAGPGEFTYRALRNGRIDLCRAEAVRDLVEARTLYQARLAFSQVEGALARRIAPLVEALEEWMARTEAAVEFVDEAETQLARAELGRAIEGALEQCRALVAGFRHGRVVRQGAVAAIVGRPNVGKSSLFNRLLERDRAIVTEIAGTTRDTLEEDLDVAGIPVRLVDTAGLRAVDDPVEGEGVRRARAAGAEADLVLLVLDGSRALELDEREMLERCCCAAGGERERTIVVRNKSDLPARVEDVPESVAVSARTGAGLDALRGLLRERLVGRGPLEDPIVTDARHAGCLDGAASALARARESARAGLSEELVLVDLAEARRALGEIKGELTTDELYDRIFSSFCIGK
jgi:tRNA modification GTPase